MALGVGLLRGAAVGCAAAGATKEGFGEGSAGGEAVGRGCGGEVLGAVSRGWCWEAAPGWAQRLEGYATELLAQDATCLRQLAEGLQVPFWPLFHVLGGHVASAHWGVEGDAVGLCGRSAGGSL